MDNLITNWQEIVSLSIVVLAVVALSLRFLKRRNTSQMCGNCSIHQLQHKKQ